MQFSFVYQEDCCSTSHLSTHIMMRLLSTTPTYHTPPHTPYLLLYPISAPLKNISSTPTKKGVPSHSLSLRTIRFNQTSTTLNTPKCYVKYYYASISILLIFLVDSSKLAPKQSRLDRETAVFLVLIDWLMHRLYNLLGGTTTIRTILNYNNLI